MEEIVNKLKAFKQAIKNGLLDGTIKYTRKYRYNSATPHVDWCDVEFTIDGTKLCISVGKYTRDNLCTKAGTFITSTINELLKGIFTKEEERQFCEMVINKPMDQLEVDEEIEYYESKIRELKHE